jgi:hypothetical protein
MKVKKSTWIYVSLFAFILLLLYILVFANFAQRLKISLPLYFFLLIICALAATAFLTQAMNSSAEYSGALFKGTLKLTGSAVIFIIILLIGYKYRPVEQGEPISLTILINGLSDNPDLERSVRVDLDNSPRREEIDKEGKAVFNNIDRHYLGEMILVTLRVDGYKISEGADTLVKIPDNPLPVIRFTAKEVIDSSMFSGYLLRSSQNLPSSPVSAALLDFGDFRKQVHSDTRGHFEVFLPAKNGRSTMLTILQNDKGVFSDHVVLSQNMQIILHD